MITGKAKLAGVIGWPIEHSQSPRLHNYWLHQYGIDGAYVPLAVAPDGFETALRGLKALGFKGVNVTIPHKLTALAGCDEVDDLARRIGAVNTIVIDPDGATKGRNTDAFGFIENLQHQWVPDGKPAVVIGAGGAARAVCVALQDAGVREIRLCNRTEERAKALAVCLGDGVATVPWADRSDALADAELLVNTTSLGMTGQPPLLLNLEKIPATAVVNDIVYAPLETPLLAAARARGNPCVDGLGMLLHQARPGFEAWFGRLPDVTPALRQYILDGM